ncbi:hypothetical protein, partial [Schlesneria sp.]|uniref:hypothetical protein n=1 Tax=Schlesneria sp. TaxID=2762018 RepID=UPI002F22EB41
LSNGDDDQRHVPSIEASQPGETVPGLNRYLVRLHHKGQPEAPACSVDRVAQDLTLQRFRLSPD